MRRGRSCCRCPMGGSPPGESGPERAEHPYLRTSPGKRPWPSDWWPDGAPHAPPAAAAPQPPPARSALLGTGVGLACWPLNAVDHWQDRLLGLLPGFSGKGWSPTAVGLGALPPGGGAPAAGPAAGPWADGRGSGIPQAMASLHDPHRSDELLAGPPPGGAACCGPSPASRCFRSAGRARGAGGRAWPTPCGAAGLRCCGAWCRAACWRSPPGRARGGVQQPPDGVVFMAEELTGRFQASLIWPGLLVCATAP